VLPVWNLRTVYRAVDEDLVRQLSKGFYGGELTRLPEGQSATGLDRTLSVEYLPDGTGLPSADHDGVESVVAEVNRAVELVFEHARLRPRTSLAVVTGSLRHAARIGEAIRAQLPNYPMLGSFFSAGDESFRVVDLERAQGLVRDHVIFSPGYGRTPHGRTLHSLGPLSAEGGRAKFALAMTRARRSLHVLSCFRPEDLDVSRLSHGAVDFYELLDREIAGNTDLGSPASRAAASEQALGADPLVADPGTEQAPAAAPGTAWLAVHAPVDHRGLHRPVGLRRPDWRLPRIGEARRVQQAADIARVLRRRHRAFGDRRGAGRRVPRGGRTLGTGVPRPRNCWPRIPPAGTSISNDRQYRQ
jgi:hypothetical protein